MAQKKQTSTQTATSTASTTAAPRRTVRKPPVIERAGVNALETPATTAPAVSPPAPSPPAAAGGAQATTTTRCRRRFHGVRLVLRDHERPIFR